MPNIKLYPIKAFTYFETLAKYKNNNQPWKVIAHLRNVMEQAQRCSRPTAFLLMGIKGVLLMGIKGVLLMGHKGVLLLETIGILHM